MCGICGYVDKKQAGIDLRERVRSMNRHMVHRGPDEEGILVRGNTAMAMRRLVIIDPETGSQPIFNEDGSLAVVCNGEIYNFKSLRHKLTDKGHRFTTASDTEVIVHAWEEFGPDFVNHLEGMFALALLDICNQTLVLARDRAGMKPLYYRDTGDFFAFASEMRPLLQIPGVAGRINPKAADQYLTLGYSLCPETLVQDICKLPPAHCLTVNTGGAMDLRSYWRIRQSEPGMTKSDVRSALRAELARAVQTHMVSDVPIGAFLSGGIDSGIVTGLMARFSETPVKTFSIGFTDQSYNELHFARILADAFHTDHHEAMIGPSAPDLVDEVLNHMDEPLSDTSLVPTLMVARLAAKEVRVVLSGDGGDELFGGYDTYMAHLTDRAIYRYLPPALRNSLLPRLLDKIHPASRKKGPVNRVKRFVEGAGQPEKMKHYRWMTALYPPEKALLYSDSFKAGLSSFVETQIDRAFDRFTRWDEKNRMMLADFHIYLPEDILAKVDRMGMAASLETRMPFLDRRVVDLAFGLPGNWKIDGVSRKAVLKSAFSDMLPPAILARGKEGFSMPMKNWLKTDLRPLMADLLSARALEPLGLFDPARVSRLMDQHVRGTHDHGRLLWAMMALSRWWHTHVLKGGR
ncbi:MAG: asparagine synthase (glutamine-hydrolyzing) [Thermodesulfobacteriota bacterium]